MWPGYEKTSLGRPEWHDVNACWHFASYSDQSSSVSPFKTTEFCFCSKAITRGQHSTLERLAQRGDASTRKISAEIIPYSHKVECWLRGKLFTDYNDNKINL